MQSYKKFVNLRARKFHFPKYKKNIFWRKYNKRVCLFFVFIFRAWA